MKKEEVLEVKENGEYIVHEYLGRYHLKSHYKTLEDVKHFHPNLEVIE